MASDKITKLKPYRLYVVAIAFATMVLLLMQYQYWYGEYGYGNFVQVQKQLQEQSKLNEEQSYKNAILLADVKDLKSGLSAIEEHARLDLGLIKAGETFVQLSNAPITYSRSMLTDDEQVVETVDAVPEPSAQ